MTVISVHFTLSDVTDYFLTYVLYCTVHLFLAFSHASSKPSFIVINCSTTVQYSFHQRCCHSGSLHHEQSASTRLCSGVNAGSQVIPRGRTGRASSSEPRSEQRSKARYVFEPLDSVDLVRSSHFYCFASFIQLR